MPSWMIFVNHGNLSFQNFSKYASFLLIPVENFLVLSGCCRGDFHPLRAAAGNVKKLGENGKFLPDEKKIAKPLFCRYSIPAFLSSTISNGQVSEWSNEHAWKVCVPQTGTEGSNPSLSAINLLPQ